MPAAAATAEIFGNRRNELFRYYCCAVGCLSALLRLLRSTS